MNEPRWYRKSDGHVFGWEIYSWKSFYINIAIGTFEFQINNWPKESK